MGTWGPGNFENDYALDYINEVIDKYIKEIEDLFNDEYAADLDELGEGVLIPNVVIITAIIENTAGYIYKDIVKKWKEKYLNIYDSQIDVLGAKEEYKIKRRKIIEETFEKLEDLSRTRKIN
ncbi:MAG: DUF4259 domain-containing protein [Candidatus Lokiarchaeota archaeon]|nr:DUF4259 domain-containing protein [Candidatus Lokiarchaeota archaeon]